MKTIEQAQVQKYVGRVIDVSLLMLVFSAWSAHRFPSYSSHILAATVTVAIAISAASLIAASRSKRTSELTTDLPQNIAETRSSPDKEIETSVDKAQLVQSIIDRYVKASQLSLFSQEHRLHFYPLKHFAAMDIAKYRRTENLIDITPPDPENYTIRIGLVTIKVRSGHTEIDVAQKEDTALSTRRRPGAEESDVLRPELAFAPRSLQ